MCPAEFTSSLPNICLDGELFAPGFSFEELNSIVRRHEPDDRWLHVKFLIFDIPSTELLRERTINNANMKMTIRDNDKYWTNKLNLQDNRFYKTIDILNNFCYIGKYAEVLKQTQVKNESHLNDMLDEVLRNNGEGLMLKHHLNIWEPKRSNMLLKVKPFLDSEGVITGLNPGQGKYLGMLGSIEVEWFNPILKCNKRFNISGFTDAERLLTWELGSTITFKYRRLTEDGVPYEARYWRQA